MKWKLLERPFSNEIERKHVYGTNNKKIQLNIFFNLSSSLNLLSLYSPIPLASQYSTIIIEVNFVHRKRSTYTFKESMTENNCRRCANHALLIDKTLFRVPSTHYLCTCITFKSEAVRFVSFSHRKLSTHSGSIPVSQYIENWQV